MQRIFHRIGQLFDAMFLPNMQFECCIILQGIPGDNVDIFAASVESIAWVLLCKTRSRSIGVRVCPVTQFNFFGTAFDPRAWTLVVFWNENSRRQPQLITPENEGRGSTNYPSPPNVDDPAVPFGPQGPQPPEPPEPHQPPGPPGSPVYRQDGLHRVSDHIRDLHRPSLNLFQYQRVMANMMISHHSERGKGNGLDRVSEYILKCRCRRNHTFNLWLLQNLMMKYQMRIFRLLIPHHHQLDHNHRLNKGIAPEDTKDLDHVGEKIHVHPRKLVNNNSLLYLLLREYSRIRQLRVKMKIQQPWVHRIM